MKRKNIALLLSAVLVLVGAVGVTIAWLMDDAGPVNNKFTPSTIEIDITETDSDDVDTDKMNNSYKMIPGFTIAKDPVATVNAGSEACLLFVTVTESDNFDDFMTYTIAEGWSALDGVQGVYYREVAARDEDQHFNIIQNNEVIVKDTVTKEMMDALTANTYPKLSFDAQAIQLYRSNGVKFEASNAWEQLNPPPVEPGE